VLADVGYHPISEKGMKCQIVSPGTYSGEPQCRWGTLGRMGCSNPVE
jgi:hypothetical protein